MSQHRASRFRTIAVGAALTGATLVGLAGAALAATPPALPSVPDLGPVLSVPNDARPDPAPEAPSVEPSSEAFDSDQPIQQLRDVAPAGVPAAGLVDVVSKAPKQIAPTLLRNGTVGE